jgi:hypothetical protein
MFGIVSQFRLSLLARPTTLVVVFRRPRCTGMLRNSIVQEGDIQVTIPHALYREALLWIRRTHRSLTVDE